MSCNIHHCIVIPCYNEEKKFLFQEYHDFLISHDNVLLCFVNDGSTDGTLHTLENIQKKFPEKIIVLNMKKNLGKAGAVRQGMLHCCKELDFKHISFLDADLAVSLQECDSLTEYFNEHIVFCFGSRILKIGSVIERKRSRFVIGRIIATFISDILSIKVYDTQCGCKLFTKALAESIFSEAFLSRWMFDVEIFFRIIKRYGKDEALTKMLEIPLKRWVDPGDSKVKMSYFFKLWLDLYRIKKAYR